MSNIVNVPQMLIINSCGLPNLQSSYSIKEKSDTWINITLSSQFSTTIKQKLTKKFFPEYTTVTKIMTT